MTISVLLDLLKNVPPEQLVGLLRTLFPSIRTVLVEAGTPVVLELATRNGLKWNTEDSWRATESAVAVVGVLLASEESASALSTLVSLYMKGTA